MIRQSRHGQQQRQPAEGGGRDDGVPDGRSLEEGNGDHAPDALVGRHRNDEVRGTLVQYTLRRAGRDSPPIDDGIRHLAGLFRPFEGMVARRSVDGEEGEFHYLCTRDVPGNLHEVTADMKRRGYEVIFHLQPLGEREVAHDERDSAALREQLTETEHAMRGLREELAAVRQELAAARNLEEGYRSAYETSATEAAALRQQLSDAHAASEGMRAQLEHVGATVKTTEAAYREAQAALEQLRSGHAGARDELALLREQAETHQTVGQGYEAEIAELRRQLEETGTARAAVEDEVAARHPEHQRHSPPAGVYGYRAMSAVMRIAGVGTDGDPREYLDDDAEEPERAAMVTATLLSAIGGRQVGRAEMMGILHDLVPADYGPFTGREHYGDRILETLLDTGIVRREGRRGRYVFSIDPQHLRGD